MIDNSFFDETTEHYPKAIERKIMKGQVTFGDNVSVTFPVTGG